MLATKQGVDKMNMEELTPHIEELKRVLNGKVDEDTIIKELDTYLNSYQTSIDAAKRGIIRKYGETDTSFVTAESVVKKIGELRGNEPCVDITARAVYVDRKTVNVKGSAKKIISGIIGDETGSCSFTIWEDKGQELEKGCVYVFKNVYTKVWNDKVQVNMGNRGKIESSDVKIEMPDRSLSLAPTEAKIGEIKDGIGNISVTGRIISVETRNITVQGEPKQVWSGIIADDTGKIQYSAWNDYSLKEGETIRIENAYVRAWRGIPQLNMGDRCTLSRVDDTFGNIEIEGNKKTIGQLVAIGGGLDMIVTGSVVSIRQGSGLIRRCPECNRSVLNDECTAHGKVEGVYDLRMKLIIDDGTGAISTILNRELTEKLTGVTLGIATELAKTRGDSSIVASSLGEKIMMQKLTIKGNVMSDDYGLSMIVQEADAEKPDVSKDAEKLLSDVEAAL